MTCSLLKFQMLCRHWTFRLLFSKQAIPDPPPKDGVLMYFYARLTLPTLSNRGYFVPNQTQTENGVSTCTWASCWFECLHRSNQGVCIQKRRKWPGASRKCPGTALLATDCKTYCFISSSRRCLVARQMSRKRCRTPTCLL